MAKRQVVFLTTQGYSVPDEVVESLLHVGRELVHKDRTRKHVSLSCAEVSISTKGKRAMLNSICGMLFTAVVEADIGKRTMQYLIEDALLEGPADFEFTQVVAGDHAANAAWN